MSAAPGVPDAVRADVESVIAGEPTPDRTVFLARLHRHWPHLLDGLRQVYGDAADAAAATASVQAAHSFRQRPADLRLLDLRRHVEPDWFQSPRMLGYAAYAERFGGTLPEVAKRASYLAELGVTYLHLLPLLAPRPRPNDGGYAVMDFRTVRPELGTMADLSALATELRAHGITLTLDLVLNHVAREHEWAVRARAGEERYRRYFHIFPDRTLPDAYEQTLPEVFPAFAPGNFTWDDDLPGWVWTTFNTWQWDLDWGNPDVFAEFADVVLFLANQGVECLRLDAIAFVWKRLGTTCQNQPEVHALTQALRAIARIAAPALVFKAEAIVGPTDLVPYLGVGEHAGLVSDLAYHNSFMVQMWSSLAARDARLATVALRRFPPKPVSTGWATYIRCHDDVGWAIDDGDAASVGWNGFSHRTFLSDYYSGEFPGSPARGLVFQFNPQTFDRRISGSAASLAGLEAALAANDPLAVELAVRRLVLLHTAMLGFGGLPLVWMGDEIALCNDADWAADPEHSDDNRWVHRPRMPWGQVDGGLAEGSPGQRVWEALRHGVTVRSGLPAMHGSIESVLLDPVNPAVLAWRRPHPRQPVVALHNLSEHHQGWPLWAVPINGPVVDLLRGGAPRSTEADVVLSPYDVVWLAPAMP